MEAVSLLLLAALLVTFHIFPFITPASRLSDTEILRAFGHPALVAICSLMILGRGLTKTGAMEPAVRLLARLWSWNRPLGFLLTLVMAGLASGFVNDTPVLVLVLPMLLGIAERTKHAASKTLMPVNFSILAGGMLTSVGTSTNLLVLSIAVDLGMKPMGIFEFTPVAAVAFAVALPYLWLVAPRLLPDLHAPNANGARLFEARMPVGTGERLLKKSVADLSRTLGRPMPVKAIRRAGRDLPDFEKAPLEAGDLLLLRDTRSGLREIASAFKADLYNRGGEGRFVVSDSGAIEGDTSMAELVVGASSGLVGQTLREAAFSEVHQIVVVGLSRARMLPPSAINLGDVVLESGDVLLAQGPSEHLAAFRASEHLMMLSGRVDLPRNREAPWALGIMAVVIVMAATKVLPIHVAAFMGVLAMLATGCVKLNGLGRALSPEVILLVASSIALGQSLVDTGAAAWVAGGVTLLVENFPPAARLVVFMAFGAVLTNFVSNTAAAAVGTPIAVATAAQLGSPLEPFVLSILFGANLSYSTPMAYQTNVLVMNAAGYRFMDFVRVGTPLVVLMLITLSILLVRTYNL